MRGDVWIKAVGGGYRVADAPFAGAKRFISAEAIIDDPDEREMLWRLGCLGYEVYKADTMKTLTAEHVLSSDYHMRMITQDRTKTLNEVVCNALAGEIANQLIETDMAGVGVVKDKRGDRVTFGFSLNIAPDQPVNDGTRTVEETMRPTTLLPDDYMDYLDDE